ncbi:hypothetical protein BU24DRAFT_410731 [Aaosphaeria arxii CBS 175.79]|uniref:Mating-type alpha-pheromone receptor PreB n=1 Tax=Aaosphaeria arxii CBS 175.79 TaxID=1450172 RepID=A0A6A5XPI3_9PLEO|nr:uncharacterized protein BU24DRAFT_410731 [Aaosphaeria arxii CBS 175.79]KAF2015052.1 hypothetical protein BU24DRAFT_410731 [Aaosphaeria arxii CBS 175.79]
MPASVQPTIDVYQQTFTLLAPNGEKFDVHMNDLNYFRTQGIRLAINYGSQIGASATLLLVLLVLTRREKRKSSIFIMNALCLAFNTIRSILQSLYLTGNYFIPYAMLSYDFSRVTWHDRANTVASNTMTLLLVICIMISLSMQVWVVCITTPKLQRVLILGSTGVMALVAIGYRFAVTVISSSLAMEDKGMEEYETLMTTMTIVQALAIWSYCVVFTFKLGYALVQRRKLGMTQFGAMQIIFIMGCQNMIIPAIFSVLQFYPKVPELGSQTLTMVCIFLPLSAIWAGVIASDSNLGSSGADGHHRLLQGQFGGSTLLSTTNASGTGKGSTIGSIIYPTNNGKDPATPTTVSSYGRRGPVCDGEIHVDREWTVEKVDASTAYSV